MTVDSSSQSSPSLFPGNLLTPFVPFRYNVVLSGTLLLNVTSTGETAVIKGGAHGLLLVTDTSGEGHSAAISTHAPSVVMMLPIKDDVVPAHTVLHGGQCLECEMNF